MNDKITNCITRLQIRSLISREEYGNNTSHLEQWITGHDRPVSGQKPPPPDKAPNFTIAGALVLGVAIVGVLFKFRAAL